MMIESEKQRFLRRLEVIKQAVLEQNDNGWKLDVYNSDEREEESQWAGWRKSIDLMVELTKERKEVVPIPQPPKEMIIQPGSGKCIRCGKPTDKPYLCESCVVDDLAYQDRSNKYTDLYTQLNAIKNTLDTVVWEAFKKLYSDIEDIIKDNMKLKLRQKYALQYLQNLGGVDMELLYEPFKILSGEKDEELKI